MHSNDIVIKHVVGHLLMGGRGTREVSGLGSRFLYATWRDGRTWDRLLGLRRVLNRLLGLRWVLGRLLGLRRVLGRFWWVDISLLIFRVFPAFYLVPFFGQCVQPLSPMNNQATDNIRIM